jgi:hypothetical protein
MALVAIAATAADLCTDHSVAHVPYFPDMIRVEGLKEARPSGTGFKLGAGSKQRQAAEPAGVDPLLFVVEEAPAKGRLRAMIQQNPPFLGVQPFAENIAIGVAEWAKSIA